jgi:hypothetical protein
MKAAFLAVAVLAAAGVVFYFPAYSSRSSSASSSAYFSAYSSTAVASRASESVSLDLARPGQEFASQGSPLRRQPSSPAISLPLFFEPNQGQTAAPVKFLAHGAGYGLFLTADEAVLDVQHSDAGTERSVGSRLSGRSSRRASSSVIRMRIDGANTSARVSGASPLPGRSNYFIGNDASKWRQNVPQFARVEYQGVYPGVDLVYYGDQGQLEYDFRVAPGADPSQIALSFQGASARIDSGDSGDLILSTGRGEVRFHAPRIYQRVGQRIGQSIDQVGAPTIEKLVKGSFRQLAANKVGFTIGDYDHSRELVIDPTLNYLSYVGGNGTELLTQVAVDTAGNIYVAGSTTSSVFPFPPSPAPIQGTLGGSTAQNIFIAVINPLLQPPTYTAAQQLVYATYLGGSGTDSLAGLAVDGLFSIYVAGTTNSTDFPTGGTVPAFQPTPEESGTHGFVSKLAFPTSPAGSVYGLAYSTYLSGNGVDNVTGLAIDTAENAYVTGDTTSTDPVSNSFPANANGFQTASNSPNNPQFFATMINTLSGSITYSTFYGGGNFAGSPADNVGGGIAVDPPPNITPNMYFTGTTNMISVPGPNGQAALPLFAAQQSCLDQPAVTGTCNTTPPTNTNAFVVKINPNQAGSAPVYATYLGGSGPDYGIAIAVDTSANAYVTGLTYSNNWVCNCTDQYQSEGYLGSGDAYIAKIGPESGSIFPLNYFTYLGNTGGITTGNGIQVDPNQAVHVVGTTYSPNLILTPDALQGYGQNGDAFVALISTTSGATDASAPPTGDYVTYLGGAGLDEGTSVALDAYYSTYAAGTTTSTSFVATPTSTPFQGTLPGSPAAFVSKIGAASTLSISAASGSPSPPTAVPAGTQAAFTFNITNSGPDNAFNIVFYGTVSTSTGLATPPTGKVTTGTGYCSAEQGTQIPCNIPSLPAGTTAMVEIDVTPAISTNQPLLSFTVTGVASANNGPLQTGTGTTQTEQVVDFTASAQNSTPTITAGDVATIQVMFCPSIPSLGYSATITPTQTTSPSMVTATTPTFNPTTVVLSGSSCGTTTLSIPTVARPVNSGGLLRRGSFRSSFYAAWLPIGGLSLMGLTIGGLSLGAGSKRRRWLIGALLGLVAGLILLQPACGSSSTTVTTNGGTSAGIYIITISGGAGTGASHNTQVQLQVI